MTMTHHGTLSIAEALDSLLREPFPIRFTAYDGSATGPEDSPFRLHLATERGLNYLLTAPGDLGFSRAYVAGDLELSGAHPGDPYEMLTLIQSHLSFRRPSPSEALTVVRSLGLSHLKPVAPPPQETPSRLRRTLEGVRHSLGRDAEAIQHHYDVSNRFYELVLGPSMTYTCALFPTEDATLEEAQAAKYDLVARKLDLRPGQRLLDLGCGWGGMGRQAARAAGNPPSTSRRSSSLRASGSISMPRESRVTAALLTRMSIPPSSRFTAAIMASTAAGSPTSAKHASAPSTPATAASRASRECPAFMATRAPSAARRRAIARPMPRLAPVTSARFPESSLSIPLPR